MTVHELYAKLTTLIETGHGDRTVRMGDPATCEYQEVTGLWIPDDEDHVDLECVVRATVHLPPTH